MNSTQKDLSEVIARGVEDIVKLYDFSDDTVVSPLSESENKVFLISDPDRADKYVARVNSGRLAYHTPPSVASELTWMMALRRDTDIVVPEVLSAKDGSLVQTITVTDVDKPRCVAIYSFIPGIEPPADELMPGFERLGEITGHMNLHAKSWTPPHQFTRHSWTPDNILNDRLNWGPWQEGVGIEREGLKLLSQAAEVVRNRLATLSTDREYLGLIHGDLRAANLLVDGDQTAIIDFDDCGFGWYLFDLATALSFLEERADVPDLIASWLEGYRRVAQVPADMEAEIPTLITLRRIQLIGWLGYQQQHLEFAREIGADFTTDSYRLAEEYLSHFA
ncbi:MAG: phosphotransferase [Gammaproteobacteria bacterium]|nr:phosphotransferase [Gammaproteobacteria bacterium]MDH3464776.1 phosphotransferase [Gammaproteobacteria bacterium]